MDKFFSIHKIHAGYINGPPTIPLQARIKHAIIRQPKQKAVAINITTNFSTTKQESIKFNKNPLSIAISKNTRISHSSLFTNLRFLDHPCVPPLENDFAELLANTVDFLWFAGWLQTFLPLMCPGGSSKMISCDQLMRGEALWSPGLWIER